MTRARHRTASPAVEIVVEAGAWPAARSLRRLTEAAIAAAARKSGRTIAPNSEVAVVFADDAYVRALNRRFRGKDRRTNVLSFPMTAVARGSYGPLLGDIMLGHQTVKAEAEGQGVSLADHLTHLIVHGFLHLLGYDHAIEAEALAMERRETAILKGLGVADPYAAEPKARDRSAR
jgi:probable rRNA maturation factor